MPPLEVRGLTIAVPESILCLAVGAPGRTRAALVCHADPFRLSRLVHDLASGRQELAESQKKSHPQHQQCVFVEDNRDERI